MRPPSSLRLALVGAIAGLLALSATAVDAAPPGVIRQVEVAVQDGFVFTDSEPLPGVTVSIVRAGTDIASAQVLGTTTADGDGAFSVDYEAPSDPDAVLYLIAVGSDGVRLASILGSSDIPDSVVINERTTVATSYAMAQFISGAAIGGPDPGMSNAAAISRNIVNVADGDVSAVLETSPNAGTATLPTVNSLANMLASCVRSAGDCSTLFELALAPDGSVPTDTLDAMSNIAQQPGANVDDLLAVAQSSEVYTPALDDLTETNTFALLILYDGADGETKFMNGPGNIAFDSEGNAWVNNNYAYEESETTIACGSTLAFKFAPTGELVGGAPVGGDDTSPQDGVGAGGLYGAGYGMAVGVDDSAWITNFGFQGQQPIGGGASGECDQTPADLAVSASQFDSDGTRLSTPDGNPSASEPGGYIITEMQPTDDDSDGFGQPQGIETDSSGNIWFAGCIDGSITRFPGGTTPYDFMFIDQAFPDLVPEFDKGFDVAIDAEGDVWITGNGSSNVVEVDESSFEAVRNLIGAVGGPIDMPMGIAVDSQGNMWVADAGLPNPPCPAILGGRQNPLITGVNGNGPIGPDGLENERAAVTLIEGTSDSDDPTVTQYEKTDDERTGLRWPWGIAIDGADNPWIANFTGQRIVRICGVDEANCRGGVTGDAVGPDDGYANTALERITAVQVDPSGNVWMTNNWRLDGFSHPENPGGRQVGLFVGLAAPVVTPRQGPVQTLPNDDELPELTLTKQWVDAVDGDIATLSIAGDVSEPTTGTSTAGGESDVVASTILDGETITIAEEFGADNVGTYDATLTCSDESGLTYTPGALDGVYTVLVDSGDVECTFTNTIRQHTLVIDKEWIDAAEGDIAALRFTGVAGEMSGESTATGADGIELDTGVVTGPVLGGETISLEEVLPDTNSEPYAASLACDAGDLTYAAGASTGALVIGDDVEADSTITCTFTNAATATVTIVKDARPEADHDFSFITDLTPDSPVILDDDGGDDTGVGAVPNTWTSPPVAAGRAYSILENPSRGWKLTSATCDNGDDPSEVVPAAGENVTCTFVNERLSSAIRVTVKAVGAASNANWSYTLAIDPVGEGVTSPQVVRGTGNESDSVTFSPLELDEVYTITGSSPPLWWSVSPIVCDADDASGADGYQAEIDEADLTVECEVVLTAPSPSVTTTTTTLPLKPAGTTTSGGTTGGSSSPLPNSGGEVAQLLLIAALLVGAGIGLRTWVRSTRQRRRV